jgi:hypothetical protein
MLDALSLKSTQIVFSIDASARLAALCDHSSHQRRGLRKESTMSAIIRVVWLAGISASCAPAMTAGQQAPADAVARRVTALEQRTVELEQQVRQLEALIKREPSRGRAFAPASANARDLGNWRRLRRGLAMNEVRLLLGEPERVDAIIGTTWHYPGNARVDFSSSSGKVDGWSEPSR